MTLESLMALGLVWIVTGIFGMSKYEGIWHILSLVQVLIGAYMAVHGLARLIERVGGCVQ